MDTFTALIDNLEVPAMTVERAIERCRKMACDLGRTIVLKAKIRGKWVLLGTYEPYPFEYTQLKTATIHQGDLYACFSHPAKPLKPAKPAFIYE